MASRLPLARIAPSLKSPWSLFCAHKPHRRAMASLVELAREALTPIRVRELEPEYRMKDIKVRPPPTSARKTCKEPVLAFEKSQLSALDPTGARTRLFAKDNPDAAKVGDILLVRQRNGDPFAGVCLNIRRRSIDTGILLRGQLTRVGVEMWFKVYSPNVEGIEVVQRKEKRARRARLYYMRKPKHDMGSVENIVRQHERKRRMLGSDDGRRAGGSSRYGNKKKGKK